MIAALLVSLVLLAPAHPGAGGARPVVSLAAAPSRVELGPRTAARVELTNAGSAAVAVTAAPEGLSLDLRGRPAVRRNAAARWLVVRPSALTVRPGSSAAVEIVAAVPPVAQPGDHHAVLLFTTRPVQRTGVSVRMRVGVRVVVRVPGAIVRRLRIETLRTRGRTLELVLANRGNVTEELPRGRVSIELRRGARLLARLRAGRRELLPRTRGVIAFRIRSRLGEVRQARVEIRDGPSRSFRVRLGAQEGAARGR